MKWIWKHFSELTLEELYGAIAIREEVFVVEQGLSYVDCDGWDPKAYHLIGIKDGEIVAYLRAFAPGVKYEQAAFGRVLNRKQVRGQGIGRELTRLGVENILSTFGAVAIKISAQAYLENFYRDFGFESVGEKYFEEGILHIEMVRNI